MFPETMCSRASSTAEKRRTKKNACMPARFVPPTAAALRLPDERGRTFRLRATPERQIAGRRNTRSQEHQVAKAP